MAIIFGGKNGLESKRMLEQRSLYSVYALTLLPGVDSPRLQTRQIKDFYLNEKLLIGRVDANFNPIFINQRFLDNFGPESSTKVGLNVVTNAYKAMKKKFDRDLRVGNISRRSPVLTELRVKRAYINPFESYTALLKKRIEEFKDFVKSRHMLSKITGFESFASVFMLWVQETAKETPITRSMYFVTKNYSPLSSGLAFEVEEGSYSEDQNKIDSYYKQKNFKYFKNLAYSYGFVIDKNIPWRLVADLNSPQMTPYIEKTFGFAGGSNYVLAIAYKETYRDDIPSIIDMMVKFYNAIAKHRRRTTIIEPGATTSSNSSKTIFNRCSKKTRVIRRRPVSVVQVSRGYSDSYWLDKYIRIRNIETGLDYPEATLDIIIQNASGLVKKLDRAAALRYTVSKFDNVEHFEGSSFYDITRLDFARQDLGNEQDVAETVRRSVQASNFVIY